MLLLDFKFVNFEYVRDPKKTITSLQAIQNQPAYIIVSFPPQSIMEQAYLEQDPNVQVLSDPQTLPIKSRISGPSQLVFQLPEAAQPIPIPITIEYFLNILSTFPLKVAPAALPSLNQNSTMDDGENQSPEIRQPGPMETSIEVPFRLIISPNRYAAWVHALKEVMASQTPASPQKEVDWVELWQTRLATRPAPGEIQEGPNSLRTVRALWAKDSSFSTDATKCPNSYDSGSDTDDPFRSALDAHDRFNIVHLSSNYKLFPSHIINGPQPIYPIVGPQPIIPRPLLPYQPQPI